MTERLILIPMTYSMMSSLLKGSTSDIEKLGLLTNGKWPREDTMDILPTVLKGLREDDEPSGFDVWMIVRKEDMTIVGDAGFKGPPDEDGIVEVGYGFVEEERRKGYGFEAVNALVSWALSRDNVKAVKADCLLDNTGSIRILEKCGMHETGRDHEMIYWEIRK